MPSFTGLQLCVRKKVKSSIFIGQHECSVTNTLIHVWVNEFKGVQICEISQYIGSLYLAIHVIKCTVMTVVTVQYIHNKLPIHLRLVLLTYIDLTQYELYNSCHELRILHRFF